MQAVLIENPKAGRHSPASVRVAERALEATFELERVTTNARGHAMALAREAVEAGAKTVIAFGGDGTVNEVLNGLLHNEDSTETVLGVLPGGTTNVLARNLGFPNELVGATAQLIEAVERGDPRRLDVGRLAVDGEHGHVERAFAFAAGVVFDAEIVHRVDGSKRRHRSNDGTFTYHGVRTFQQMRKHNAPDLIVETPDGRQDAYWACISMADAFTYFRKRKIRVIPRAESTTGVDLLASRQLNFWTTLRWVQQAITTGKQVKSRNAIVLRDQDRVTIHARRPVPLQTDGEYLGSVTEIEAVPLRSAVPVWA